MTIRDTLASFSLIDKVVRLLGLCYLPKSFVLMSSAISGNFRAYCVTISTLLSIRQSRLGSFHTSYSTSNSNSHLPIKRAPHTRHLSSSAFRLQASGFSAPSFPLVFVYPCCSCCVHSPLPHQRHFTYLIHKRGVVPRPPVPPGTACCIGEQDLKCI